VNTAEIEREPDETSAGAGQAPPAGLSFVVFAFLALLMSFMGTEGNNGLAAGRRGGEARFDAGLARLQALVQPSPEHLRKAQGLKVQQKKWAPGGDDGALPATSGHAVLHAPSGEDTPAFVQSVLLGDHRKTHRPRGPPFLLLLS
jgi:hypothetical protein